MRDPECMFLLHHRGVLDVMLRRWPGEEGTVRGFAQKVIFSVLYKDRSEKRLCKGKRNEQKDWL